MMEVQGGIAWQDVKDVLTVIGGFIGLVLTGLGIAKINEIRLKRRHDQEDREDAIHESNQANKINADVTLVQELLRRVKDLETGQKDLQKELMALTTTNAEQKKTIEYLEKELDRKDRQIDDLQKESSQRQGRITQLEGEVKELQAQMQELLAVQRGEI